MPRLRIVAVNDVYTLENYPRLATLIATLAARDPVDTTLVTLAGDFLAPSLLSSLDQGRGMVEVMNALGVTHVTFGNHEDDVELSELRARMRELRATWLATNVPDFEPRLPTTAVVMVKDVRVGLIGVVDADPALYPHPPFGGARIEPPIVSAVAAAQGLLNDGCRCVIALTHLRQAEDRKLAAAMKPPFPLILGGHDHKPLLELVGDTWLGKAGADAVGALVAEVRLDDPIVVDLRFEPVAHYAEDPTLRALVDKHMRAVRELEGAALMRIPEGVELSSVGTRAGPSSLATLLCTCIRDVLGADRCLFNGGGIRGSAVYKRRFTYADLEREIPFENEVVVAEIPGDVLREAIAYSRRLVPADSGGYLHTDDRDGVQDDRTYKVALIRDMLLGMDHNTPLMDWAIAHPDAIPPLVAGREVKLVLVEAFGRRLANELGKDLDENHDGVVSIAEIAQAIRQSS